MDVIMYKMSVFVFILSMLYLIREIIIFSVKLSVSEKYTKNKKEVFAMLVAGAYIITSLIT